MTDALTAPSPADAPAGQTVLVETAYTAYINTEITLPAPLTWADVKRFWVKWGVLHAVLTDDRELTFALDDLDMDTLDYKRPDTTRILQPGTFAPLAGDDE